MKNCKQWESLLSRHVSANLPRRPVSAEIHRAPTVWTSVWTPALSCWIPLTLSRTHSQKQEGTGASHRETPPCPAKLLQGRPPLPLPGPPLSHPCHPTYPPSRKPFLLPKPPANPPPPTLGSLQEDRVSCEPRPVERRRVVSRCSPPAPGV